jgi:HD-like signal output (HDOD) protein
MKQKAQQILQKADVDKLPSLPHVLLQLLDICYKESISFTELANILRQDPALYARACSICHHQNCDTDGSPQTDATVAIEKSLQKLGINTIKSIAVTATVQQFFSRTSLERTDFLKEHWQHSLYCAHVARAIAEVCNYSNIDEVYTTGLLHNIGQLVLETAYPDKYTTTFAQLSDDTIFHTLELDEFGTTHQQVGAELLKRLYLELKG